MGRSPMLYEDDFQDPNHDKKLGMMMAM